MHAHIEEAKPHNQDVVGQLDGLDSELEGILVARVEPTFGAVDA
jgi:hypothetical protein